MNRRSSLTMMEEPTELSSAAMDRSAATKCEVRSKRAVEVELTAPTQVASAAPLKPLEPLEPMMQDSDASPRRAVAVPPPGTPLFGPAPRRRAQQWPTVEPPPRVTATLSGAVPQASRLETVVLAAHVGAQATRPSEPSELETVGLGAYVGAPQAASAPTRPSDPSELETVLGAHVGARRVVSATTRPNEPSELETVLGAHVGARRVVSATTRPNEPSEIETVLGAHVGARRVATATTRPNEPSEIETVLGAHVGARRARGSDAPTRVAGRPRAGVAAARAAESAAAQGAYSVAREVAALAQPRSISTTQAVRRPDRGTVRVVMVGLLAAIVILLSAVVVRQQRELLAIRGEAERYREVCQQLATQKEVQAEITRICTR